MINFVDLPEGELDFEEVDFDGDDFDDVVYLALKNAQKAFHDTLSRYGFDSAYCDIRFTAFINDANFEQRLRKIEIEGELK